MLKILEARLQQYVNHELPDVQAGLRKGRGTRDQIEYMDSRTFCLGFYELFLPFCFIKKYIFMALAALPLSCNTEFSACCGVRTLSCDR